MKKRIARVAAAALPFIAAAGVLIGGPAFIADWLEYDQSVAHAQQAQTGGETILVTNKAGAALAIGALVRSNGTSGQVTRAQADSSTHASGPLLVMTSPAADNGGGYAKLLPAWVLFSDTPTVGSTAYLDAANAGKATMTAPASGGTRQQRIVGLVLKTSGQLGLVVGGIENAPAAAGSTSGAVTYGTGLTYSSGTSTVTADVSTGVLGGQTITGGTGSGNSLTLRSTSNGTKGTTIIGSSSDVVVDEVNHRLGIGGTPSAALHILSGSLKLDGSLGTGLLKHTTSTGVLSIASGGTDYVAPAGVSGGQTITGGTASGDGLILTSTSNGTKGKTRIGATTDVTVDEVNHRLGVGTNSPATPLQIAGSNSLFTLGDGTGDVQCKVATTANSGTATEWIRFTNVGPSQSQIGLQGNTLKIETDGSITMANATNIAVSTSTGTKIGTATGQKIGLWNATPVAQHSSAGETTGFTAGGGTTATSASTWTGNVGSTAYTTSDIVKALKNAGIMAQ